MPFSQLTFDLLERPPELLQRLLRDADSIVLNGNNDPIASPAPSHRHGATVGGEFYRIGEEIECDLLERATVGIEIDSSFYLSVESEPFFAGAG